MQELGLRVSCIQVAGLSIDFEGKSWGKAWLRALHLTSEMLRKVVSGTCAVLLGSYYNSLCCT